jgi:hypothetical protein
MLQFEYTVHSLLRMMERWEGDYHCSNTNPLFLPAIPVLIFLFRVRTHVAGYTFAVCVCLCMCVLVYMCLCATPSCLAALNGHTHTQ